MRIPIAVGFFSVFEGVLLKLWVENSVLLTGSFHTHPGNLGVRRTRAKVLFRELLEKTASEKKLH